MDPNPTDKTVPIPIAVAEPVVAQPVVAKVAQATFVPTVLPFTWEQREGQSTIAAFVRSAWRLGGNGARTWPSVPKEGTGAASPTLFAILANLCWLAPLWLLAPLLGFAWSHDEMRRGWGDSLLAGIGALDLLVLAVALYTVVSALAAAGFARVFFRRTGHSFGEFYRAHCYGRAPGVFGLVGLGLVPGVVPLLTRESRARGFQNVLGIPRGRALFGSFLPLLIFVGLGLAGGLIAAILDARW